VKSLNFLEIQSIVEMLDAELSSAPLQDVYCVDEKISFGFYRDHQVKWVVVDLDGFFPFIALMDEPFRAGPKVTKPVSLFVRSRFLGRTLLGVSVLSEGERVLRFEFADRGQWEFRCIPKQANLICRDGVNSISWFKIKDLSQTARMTSEDLDVRSIPTLMKLWRNINSSSKDVRDSEKILTINPYEKWKAQRLKDLSKKKSAIEKLKEQVHNPLAHTYELIGEHLKVHGYKQLDLEWPKLINLEKRVSDNINLCFEKSKQIKGKAAGAQNRILVLQKEMTELSKDTFEDFERELATKKPKLSRLSAKSNQEKLSVRQKIVGENSDLVAYMGKSAQENVKLLKQSKPWHIWFHLKDYPGAYVILFFNKGARISDHTIRDVGTWLVKESFRSQSQLEGAKMAVVYTECRHLKLLKGDRLGRVTYSTAKELVISV